MTCVWEPDTSVFSDKFTALTEVEQERALLLATSSLITLTLGRVGLCPITIRPVPTAARCGCGFNPHKAANGLWYNNCHHRSLFAPRHEIDIPGPVGFIDEFKIDGEVVDLDNGDWRLDNGHLLVWQGSGPSPLPVFQDLNLPDTDAGTCSITYSRSYQVLDDGRIAVALLAEEFSKAFGKGGKCALPRGVTSVVRNGVSFTIEAGLFPNGLTNIDMVDQYILKWAPAGAPIQSATVFDPRQVRPRVTTGVPRRRPAPVPPEESTP